MLAVAILQAHPGGDPLRRRALEARGSQARGVAHEVLAWIAPDEILRKAESSQMCWRKCIFGTWLQLEPILSVDELGQLVVVAKEPPKLLRGMYAGFSARVKNMPALRQISYSRWRLSTQCLLCLTLVADALEDARPTDFPPSPYSGLLYASS